MDFVEFRKRQINHYRCVVCGKSFGARYDENLGNFPVYHPLSPEENLYESCEHRFFKTILRIYMHLHKLHSSVTMNSLLNEFDWLGHILMKKELISWSLKQGYFTLDNLSRIKIPEEIEDSCKDIFTKGNLKDPKFMEEAIDMLKAAFVCFQKELVNTEKSKTIVDSHVVDPEIVKEPSLDKRDIIIKFKTEKQIQKIRRMYTIQHTNTKYCDDRRHRALK